MDDDFAFSFFKTRQEWETENRRRQEFNKEFDRKWAEREGSKTASRIVGRKKGSRFPAFREQGPPRRDRKSGRMPTRAWWKATRFARVPCFPLDPRKGYS